MASTIICATAPGSSWSYSRSEADAVPAESPAVHEVESILRSAMARWWKANISPSALLASGKRELVPVRGEVAYP